MNLYYLIIYYLLSTNFYNRNIIMTDMTCVKYKDFLFDYLALDVDRLKGMFGL